MGCNVRASVARRSSDYEELARIRGQVEALIQTKRRTVRIGILVLAWIDFDLALEAGDWVRCNEAIGMMRAIAATPLQKLSLDYEIARLAEAQGDLALAREHFAVVEACGGNVHPVSDARAWIASHPAKEIEDPTATTA